MRRRQERTKKKSGGKHSCPQCWQDVTVDRKQWQDEVALSDFPRSIGFWDVFLYEGIVTKSETFVCISEEVSQKPVQE